MAQPVEWKSRGLGRWRRHAVPVVVWLAALGGVVWIFGHRAQRFEVVGIARAELRQIAAETTGRLMTVPVRPFEQVKQGQTLAVLIDDRIQAQLATAGAEAARLQAELTAAEHNLIAQAKLQEAEHLAEARRFVFDIEQTRLRWLELKVVLETDRISLQRELYRRDRLLELRERDAADEYELQTAQTRHDELVKKIAENEKVLAQIELDRKQAQLRHGAHAERHPADLALDKVLAPFRAAVTVQEARIAELSLERSMLVLRSPIDGVVNEVLRGAGEALMPGEPILTIAASQPSEVIAYATADQASRLTAGMPVKVQLLRPGLLGQVAESRVLAVGPAAVQLPIQLWANPAFPEWGWPIAIALTPELKLLSGERVGIRGM